MASPEEIKEAAEEQLQSITEGGVSAYSIGNRSVTKLDPEKLMKVAMLAASEADRRQNGAFRIAKFGRRR